MKVMSKRGSVVVELWRDATTVHMEVIKMPQWLRGKYGRGNPMHRWDGFSLCSDAEPGLESAIVLIGGTCWKGDGRGASRACLTIGEAIAYFDKARCLIESFDSVELYKSFELWEAEQAEQCAHRTASQRLDEIENRVKRLERWFYEGFGKRIEVEG